MKKITEKQLIPHLPYKPTAIYIKGNGDLDYKGRKMNVTLWTAEIILKSNNWKLMLRPLSDLIKPILPDGKIPLVELAKTCYKKVFNYIPEINDLELLEESENFGLIAFDEDNHRISLTHDKDERFYSFSFYVDGDELKVNQKQLFDQLHEWHFDVDGLIENGTAIDINTI